MTTSFRNLLKRASPPVSRSRSHFGFDVLPRHFYSEIPDLRILRKTTSWRKEYPMTGVNGADPRGQTGLAPGSLAAELVRKAEEGNVYRRRAGSKGSQVTGISMRRGFTALSIISNRAGSFKWAAV